MKIVYDKGITTTKRGSNDWIGYCVGRYEYICCSFDDYKDALSCKYIDALIERGWQKAWADMQTEGAFVVFRREV